MSVQADIFAKLSDSASATSALAGSGSSCRVYPEFAPAKSLRPYAVVQHVATSPATTHNEAFGTAHLMLQVACFADTFDAAQALRDAIVADLDNVELASRDAPVLQDERSTYEPAVDLFRADADFLV